MRRQKARKRLINVNIRGIFIRMLYSATIGIILHPDSYSWMLPKKGLPIWFKSI